LTARRARVERRTKETSIDVRVNLDAGAPLKANTGIGFFDHMLEQLAKHGGFSLELTCEGDLQIDERSHGAERARSLSESDAAQPRTGMLVDLQVTLTGELEREPPVLGELLEHVIEEANPGVGLERRAGIEIHPHVDARLLRARSTRARRAVKSCTTADQVSSRVPWRRTRSRARRGWMQTRESVSRSPIMALEARSTPRSRTYCSTSPVLGLRQPQPSVLTCGQTKHGIELDPLRAEGVQDELLRPLECRAREGIRARPSWFVTMTSGNAPLELRERREHPGQETHLLQRVNLLAGRLLHERAVAIDEQRAGWDAHCHASRSRSFCSIEPIVMRRARPRPGYPRASRTSSRASRARARAAPASVNSARRNSPRWTTRAPPGVERERCAEPLALRANDGDAPAGIRKLRRLEKFQHRFQRQLRQSHRAESPCATAR